MVEDSDFFESDFLPKKLGEEVTFLKAKGGAGRGLDLLLKKLRVWDVFSEEKRGWKIIHEEKMGQRFF